MKLILTIILMLSSILAHADIAKCAVDGYKKYKTLQTDMFIKSAKEFSISNPIEYLKIREFINYQLRSNELGIFVAETLLAKHPEVLDTSKNISDVIPSDLQRVQFGDKFISKVEFALKDNNEYLTKSSALKPFEDNFLSVKNLSNIEAQEFQKARSIFTGYMQASEHSKPMLNISRIPVNEYCNKI